jgi:dihydroorotate dehydrogenase (NAD+) catalytic subunit
MISSGTFGWDGYGRGVIDEKPPGGPVHPVTTGPQLLLPGIAAPDFQRLGAVVAKTATMHPREGNPEPKWHPRRWRPPDESEDLLYLNSIGLTNPGLQAMLDEKAPVWADWGVPVILSIAGETVEEFGTMASMTEGKPGVAGLELNLSCPNVDNGAHFSHLPEVAEETVGRVKAETSLPVIPKLSPNVPNIVRIAEAVTSAGADAITISNTIPAMSINPETGRPTLGTAMGGLSGPGLRPVAVALVYQASQAVKVPIIGSGGIFSSDHALEFIMAGAAAVQVGTANLTNFWAPLEVLDGLRSYIGEMGIASVSDLVGIAWKQ